MGLPPTEGCAPKPCKAVGVSEGNVATEAVAAGEAGGVCVWAGG